MVKLKTNMGEIVLELDPQQAPVTVENFLSYVKEGFYDGTVFHRVINGFMIQGGGMNQKMEQKPTKESIQNEASNDLSNVKGSIAMARTNDPDSATSQFFINLVDNSKHLDPGPSSGAGYTVFGKVVEGMDVVEKIGKVVTGSIGFHDDVPVEPVIIEHGEVVTQ